MLASAEGLKEVTAEVLGLVVATPVSAADDAALVVDGVVDEPAVINGDAFGFELVVGGLLADGLLPAPEVAALASSPGS